MPDKIKILVIEDSVSAVEMIKDMLLEARHVSFDVETADCLADGLERLSREGIEAVLLDLGLPDSSGFDTFTKVQTMAPMMPIVVLTHLEDEEVIMKIVQAGAQDYLIKNKVDSDILERSLRYSIERKKSEEELRKARDELETMVEARTLELAGTNEELLLIIQEQKQAEEALQKSEEKYRLVVENAGDGIVIIQDDRHKLFNSRALEITGYTEEEYSSLSPLKIIHPDDRAKMIEEYRKDMEGAEVSSIREFRIIDKNGNVTWLQFTTALMEWEGSPATLAILHDITDRKIAERALEEQVRLEILRADVGAAFDRSEKLMTSLQYCTEAIVENLGVALARIWLLNQAEGSFKMAASSGLSDNIQGNHGSVPLDHSKIGLIAREKKPLYINPLERDSRIHDQEWAGREGLKEFAGYPMMADDKVMGVIGIFSREAQSEVTLKALESISDRIAMGIKDRQMQDELQEARWELEFKAAELESINEELSRYAVVALDANPLTQLPGNNTINKTIQDAIDGQQDMAVLYCDLDNFKSYNDRYGFSAGDRVIIFIANILYEAMKELSSDEAFLGHIGGDDFVLILPSDQAESFANEIIKRFEKKINEFYSKEERDQGYVYIKDRTGDKIKFPFVSVSLAGVCVMPGRFSHFLQVSAACADVKTKAKSVTGNVFLLDRRRGKYEMDSSIPESAFEKTS